MPRKKFAWASLPDEQLLGLRLRDLKVTLEGTWLEDCLKALHEELEERDIRVRPHAWISSEWFSPDSTPGIAFPFYLAHPRLMQLEKKKILEHSPSRSRARCSALLSAPAQSPLAAAVRSLIETLSEILPPEPCQPAFRPAPAALVRAEPSGRGFRRNICGLAATPLELAHALCRLAGTEEARIRR